MEQQKQKANQTNTENTTSQENLPDVDSQEEGIKITHWKDLLHAWGKMSQNNQHQYIKLIFKKMSLDIQAKTKKLSHL